jgi:nucleoid-associated protein YgaU
MYRLVALTFIVIIGLIVGCSNGTKTTSAPGANPGVLDVASAPTPTPAPAPEPIAMAPIAEPIAYSAPAPQTTAVAAKPSGSYTVKKGDTLFSIAKASYGSGGQWKKIVAANPGLEPSKLKAGQTITIP